MNNLNKILEEMKLFLFINNNIIIKKNIISRLVELFNYNVRKRTNLNILLCAISYIWFLKDKKLLSEVKCRLFTNKYEQVLLEGISINYSINLQLHSIYLMDKNDKNKIINFDLFHKLKYIPNVLSLNFYGIIS